MTGSEPQRVLVKYDRSAKIRCPHCGMTKVVNLSSIAEVKPVMRVKCECSSVFAVKFEYRKFYRKKTDLAGVYRKYPGGENSPQQPLSRKKMNCRVVNISMSGAGFVVLGEHVLAPGDRLLLGFALDNAQRTWVEKGGFVRVVEESYVGLEFEEAVNTLDKALGFYLMP